jgi:hypothetical protein
VPDRQGEDHRDERSRATAGVDRWGEIAVQLALATKSGKKRTHTPTNDELKDTGLRVAKDQPHLPASTSQNCEVEPPASRAEQALAASWKSRSPACSGDGALIAPPDDPGARFGRAGA